MLISVPLFCLRSGFPAVSTRFPCAGHDAWTVVVMLDVDGEAGLVVVWPVSDGVAEMVEVWPVSDGVAGLALVWPVSDGVAEMVVWTGVRGTQRCLLSWPRIPRRIPRILRRMRREDWRLIRETQTSFFRFRQAETYY